MFMEALAALDTNPGSLLIAPAADSGQSHIHVPYKVAVRAMAVHIYKHLSALLARCMRVAEELLQQRAWLLAQLKEFQTTAAAASSVAGSGSGGGVKEAAAKGAKGNSSSGSKGADAKGGSASKGADAKAPEGLDTHAAEKQLQQVKPSAGHGLAPRPGQHGYMGGHRTAGVPLLWCAATVALKQSKLLRHQHLCNTFTPSATCQGAPQPICISSMHTVHAGSGGFQQSPMSNKC